jgi:excisionase family DNA binding protein
MNSNLMMNDSSQQTRRPPAAAVTVGVNGAAMLLDLSPRTVEMLAASNSLPSFRVGRRRLFSVAKLREWADAATDGKIQLPSPGRSR